MEIKDVLTHYRKKLLVYTVACGIGISQLTACGEKNGYLKKME